MEGTFTCHSDTTARSYLHAYGGQKAELSSVKLRDGTVPAGDSANTYRLGRVQLNAPPPTVDAEEQPRHLSNGVVAPKKPRRSMAAE